MVENVADGAPANKKKMLYPYSPMSEDTRVTIAKSHGLPASTTWQELAPVLFDRESPSQVEVEPPALRNISFDLG